MSHGTCGTVLVVALLLGIADSVRTQTLVWHKGPTPLGQPVGALPDTLPITGPGGFLGFADLDHDGDLDVISGQGLLRSRLVLAPFPVVADLPDGLLPQNGSQIVSLTPLMDGVLADLDNDTDLDYVVIADFGSPPDGRMEMRRNNTLFAPGSTISFSNALPLWQYPLVTSGLGGFADIEAADLDMDGDQDLLVGSSAGLVVLVNNPSTVSPPPARNFNSVNLLPGAAVVGLARGNLNGDAITDIVRLGAAPGDVSLGMGTGAIGAPFTAVALAGVAARRPTCATIGDVNADGINDVVVGFAADANSPVGFLNGGFQVFIQAPLGVFTAFQTAGAMSSVSIAVADLERDGVSEIVVASQTEEYTPPSGPPNQVLLPGTRVFERATTLAPFADQTLAWIDDDSVDSATDMAVADYDRDGDVDVMVSYANRQYVGVFANAVAHLDAPLETAVGATSFNYTVFWDLSRPPVGTNPNGAVLGVALDAPQYIAPVPGILGDPTAAGFVTTTLLTPPGPAIATFTMTFPSGFAGTPLYAMALIINENIVPAQWSFSSVQRTVIR